MKRREQIAAGTSMAHKTDTDSGSWIILKAEYNVPPRHQYNISVKRSFDHVNNQHLESVDSEWYSKYNYISNYSLVKYIISYIL